MFYKRYLRKMSALALAGILTVQTAIPVLASELILDETHTSGTIHVTANVLSEYYLQLPASINLEEIKESVSGREEDDAGKPIHYSIEDGNDYGSAKYTASYHCNVYGTLLGQKVTLSPKLSAGDTPGNYHIEMDPLKEDETVDTSKAKLEVDIKQSVYEWIPAGSSSVASQQRKIGSEMEDDEDKQSEGTLETVTDVEAGTRYKGYLTFFVSCEDI